MKNNMPSYGQTYFDPTEGVPEYTVPGMTDKEIELMLLYRLLSLEQQNQIMNQMEKTNSRA